jgi:uroporphyrinogen-III synthase
MSESLKDITVAIAEGRQLEDLAGMFEKEGASLLRCPLLSILDSPDSASVNAWLDELVHDRFGLIVLMTGEGVRRLLGFAERRDASFRESVIAALGQTRTLTRGPKPARALKEIGLSPTLIAEAPTTEGVIATLRRETLKGMTVGVQLYAPGESPLVAFIEQQGGKAHPVLPYVYAPAADGAHVAELIRKLDAGEAQVLVITSSPQVDRLFEVAAERGMEVQLRQGLARCCVAAVGPIAADSLKERGITVHVCPEQGFVMKNLVQQIVRWRR